MLAVERVAKVDYIAAEDCIGCTIIANNCYTSSITLHMIERLTLQMAFITRIIIIIASAARKKGRKETTTQRDMRRPEEQGMNFPPPFSPPLPVISLDPLRYLTPFPRCLFATDNLLHKQYIILTYIIHKLTYKLFAISIFKLFCCFRRVIIFKRDTPVWH